jgi:thiol-disulfide isomerase/thioredoxin
MRPSIIIFFLLNICVSAQEINTLITDSSSGNPILIGFVTRDAFKDTSFSWWYESEYNNYDPDTVALESLVNRIHDLSVTIILGTWCSDSRREVPRFLKIMDRLKFNSTKQLTIICVDRDKKGKGEETAGLDIQLVPTIIISQKGKELGRIIESPKATLEKDIRKIIPVGNQ